MRIILILLVVTVKMLRNRSAIILLFSGIILMLSAFIFNNFSALKIEQIAHRASLKIEQKALLCNEALSLNENSTINTNDRNDENLFLKEGIALYRFNGDSLVFWNNSRIPVSTDLKDFPKEQGFVKLFHGYYLYLRSAQKSDTVSLALCLIKPWYDLQNNYLRNDFLEWTGVPADIGMQTDGAPDLAVRLGEKTLFYLQGNEPYYFDASSDTVALLLFYAGFICLLISILVYAHGNGSALTILLAALVVVAFRALMLWLKFPAFNYRHVLFDLKLFGNAQSFLNGYLGDIFLNALCILFLTALIRFSLKPRTSKLQTTIVQIFLFAFLLWTAIQFNKTIISLVSNSTLNFDFLSIFNIKVPAFIGLAALSAYSLAILLLLLNTLDFYKNTKIKGFFKYLLIIFGLCLIQQFYLQAVNSAESFWLFVFAAVLYVLVNYVKAGMPLILGFQILIMSAVTAAFLNFYITKNQKQDLDILSIRLSERQDAILENEFAGIPQKIAQDENLNNLIQILPNTEKEVIELLKQKFFSGYFNRYNVEFSLFDANCNPLLSAKNPVLLNEGYFDDQIIYNSDATFNEGLFFVKNYKKNAQYIGKIKLNNRNLFVLMEPKQFEELGSFPDLLLDQSQQKPEKLKNFSHAVYRSQQNTSRYGDFSYPVFLQDSLSLTGSNPDFVHHYFKPDESTDVIITEAAKKWNYFFTFNSYLLLFFSLVTYAFYLFYAFAFTTQFKNSSLTRRIQTIIIALLLVAMSAVGLTSGNLVSKQFEYDNKKQLVEKTQIIINELTDQFSNKDLFDGTQKELVNLKLKEYARLFSTPISLFDKQGYLYNTSEPKLYDLGLAASLANPHAYHDLTQNMSSSEIVNEKAGALNYKSLYTPLFNAKKELVGFVDLPYFAKQSDLVNELSGIISALINVYVILFVISILAGLILSGFITQPLRLIKTQIGKITLGTQNEKIVWQSNDEIGKLVAEYNQMLTKLEDSANLLAQSERESAWREMAKQVAHEIKNPLTPMKLNLQYLQHVMKNNPDDFGSKFEKMSAGIIEQIDSLANIATEFSNFAKLPGASLQSINLSEIIASSVLIFEHHKNIRVINHIQTAELWVKGDRDQCLRVFNNILKNAVQALDESRDPLIDISFDLSNDKVTIAIRDNGCGIDEDLKPKIFTPNFTTKNTGSGLGLAMVKNILDGFGGKIWFESEKGSKTTFYLQFLPADKNT